MRASDFNVKHHDARKTILCLFHIFDSYRIAVPKFNIFQTGLNSALYDADNTFYPFFQLLLKYLPMDASALQQKQGSPPVLMPPMTPNEKEINLIKERCSKYNNALVCINAYLYDLSVEAQNLLLGKLFNSRVPPREPLDTSLVVIRSDAETIKKLEAYFNEQTAWGKNNKQIEKDVLHKH